MGERIRSHDWAGSPLGAVETWPASLRAIVTLLLDSRLPMFVAWGPELQLLYNDAYAAMLGPKHPAAMGARIEDVWQEVWPFVSRLLGKALRREASWRKDLPLVLNRSGHEEKAWLSFSYSPVEDDAGEVIGAFCVVIDTTVAAVAQGSQALLIEIDDRLRDLEDADAILATAAAAVGEHLAADRVTWKCSNMSLDAVEIRHQWTRAGVPALAGGRRRSDFDALVEEAHARGFIAIPDILNHPLTASGAVREAIGRDARALLVAPLLRGGVTRASLTVQTCHARRWRADEVQLVRDVAERVWARAERAAAEARVRQSEQRFRALVSATSQLVFCINADWTELREVSGRGIHPDFPVPLPNVPPDAKPRIQALIQEAVAAKAPVAFEYRMEPTDAWGPWVSTRAAPILDNRGEIIEWFGASSDVSEQKEAERHLRLMVHELNHRVKNTLATVQAIAAQTLRRDDVPEEVREALADRLIALANAHDVLTQEKWSGADLADLAVQAGAPYVGATGSSAFYIDGPSIVLPPKTAIAMALAFHELATNAAKYGALSAPGGKVLIAWSVTEAPEGRVLRLTWRESGGPKVSPPKRAGFGTRLIQRGLAVELQAAVKLDYLPAGLVCQMEAILPDAPVGGSTLDLQHG